MITRQPECTRDSLPEGKETYSIIFTMNRMIEYLQHFFDKGIVELACGGLALPHS